MFLFENSSATRSLTRALPRRRAWPLTRHSTLDTRPIKNRAAFFCIFQDDDDDDDRDDDDGSCGFDADNGVAGYHHEREQALPRDSSSDLILAATKQNDPTVAAVAVSSAVLAPTVG